MAWHDSEVPCSKCAIIFFEISVALVGSSITIPSVVVLALLNDCTSEILLTKLANCTPKVDSAARHAHDFPWHMLPNATACSGYLLCYVHYLFVMDAQDVRSKD